MYVASEKIPSKEEDGKDFSGESISDDDDAVMEDEMEDPASNCSIEEEQNGYLNIQQQCNYSLDDNAEVKQELSVEEEAAARPDCVSKRNDTRRGVWCLFSPPGMWNQRTGVFHCIP